MGAVVDLLALDLVSQLAFFLGCLVGNFRHVYREFKLDGNNLCYIIQEMKLWHLMPLDYQRVAF